MRAIRLKKSMAAPRWSGGAGQVLRVGIDVPEAVADGLVAGGLADEVGAPETASVEAPERATKPRPTRRRRTRK